MRIFTWHIHGSYLFYLAQGNYQLFIPVNEKKTPGYYGRGNTFPFGKNVIEIPADEVKDHKFDCILFQTKQNYLVDQFEILSEAQRELPKIYLEHDPPLAHPTDTKHPVDDPNMVLIHVTHFNKLMWDNNRTPVKVIEHGVIMPDASFTGELRKGITVINNLPQRGRLLGFDIFEEVKKRVPIDLVGMGTDSHGLGEVLHPQLPEFEARYRFFFNPIRHTSLGLAICEAMMIGIPVIGLATTELTTVIDNGYSGFVHTDVEFLIDKMQMLLDDKYLAQDIGANGREVAAERFNIKRFVREWEELFMTVTDKNTYEKFLPVLG